MIENSLKEIEAEVWKHVESLRNNPQARLLSTEAFYQKYGKSDSEHQYGFGDSAISFLKWEQRGVLNSPTYKPPGSAWWSEVNLWLIYHSELGVRAYELGLTKSELPVPTQFWISFIENPSPVSWYRAHNSSIIDGYLKYPHLAKKETKPEEIFINMVLYRLIFAQSLVEGDFIFPRLAKIIANPRGGAVDFIIHLDGFYPSHYPLTKEEIEDILGKAHNLEEFGVQFLDDVIIEPELTSLYQKASVWNQQPELNKLIVNHKPAYPNNVPFQPDPVKHLGWLIKTFIWLRKLIWGST